MIAKLELVILGFAGGLIFITWVIGLTKGRKEKRKGILRHPYWSNYLFWAGLSGVLLGILLRNHFFEKVLISQYWSMIFTFFGMVLTFAGLLLALWARTILGWLWSSSPSVREEHLVVKRGPYLIIRHPIYAGILLMLFGSFGITRVWPSTWGMTSMNASE